MTGPELVARTYRRLDIVGYSANGLGALVLFVFVTVLVPRTLSRDEYHQVLVRTAAALAVVLVVALWLGRRRTVGFYRGATAWAADGRPATDADRERLLRYPLEFLRTATACWVIGGGAIALVDLTVAPSAAVAVAVTAVLGGTVASSLCLILSERLLRPLVGRALAGGPPPEAASVGVAARLATAWALSTAVPLLGGVVLIGADLAGADFKSGDLAGAVLFLILTALLVGLLANLVVIRSLADSIGSVRVALQRIQAGDLDTRCRVDDGSEVGLLQAGFNRMVTGLEERERLREAFGTFVDPELGERILREGTDLAGEEVEVSVLFLDVRGFTSLAERTGARDVVARLNALYERVVPIVLAHGGHANKFIGDGMLAIFGAPERLADHADRAVEAALEIARAVRDAFGGELRVGLGVNSGRVLVGTVGGGGRLDFTVIGDPVNTAARVEAATRETDDDVLITEATRERLQREHCAWQRRPPIPLKGKSEPVALYAPT